MKNNLNWSDILKEEKEKDYFKKVFLFQRNERKKGKIIYPEEKNIFKAFELTPFSDIKVVILGQDPYHGEGQAQGISFSVPTGIKIPPSLQNIFKELGTDLKIETGKNGNLESWAKQGVFLLNAVLTVEAGNPASHANLNNGMGWENFTDQVIKKISENKSDVIFLLWGNYAIKKKSLIDESKHTILTAAHPSPFSAYNGFFGCKHFSKTNSQLKKLGKEEIDFASSTL